MTQAPTKGLMLSEFLALPETKPACEYVNGQIIQKPMPQGEHSVLQGELIVAINGSLKPNQLGRAFPELRCTFGDRSIVPDISVFKANRIPRLESGRIANKFESAPDWVIEILSPDQTETRVTKNILHCLDHGTEMGWLIDPVDQSVLAYFPEEKPQFFEGKDVVLPAPEFAGLFQLSTSVLFGWLME